MTTPEVAQESGHYYHKDGTPCFTVIGANGKERPTTLRDCRKLDLVPSVTEIMKCAAKPGLEAWKMQQTMMAALTLPRIAGEDEQAFCARIISDSKEQARKAAERGTRLHGAIEKAIRGDYVEPEWRDHVETLDRVLVGVGINLFAGGKPEHSFASPEGFGGKVDFASRVAVIDFKNKPRIKDAKNLTYDEHVTQLAAYRAGLGYGPSTRLLSVFVGCEDAQVVIREWTEPEAQRGLAMFRHLLAYWRARTGL